LSPEAILTPVNSESATRESDGISSLSYHKPRRPPPNIDLDPNRYRLLVKGIISLPSSLARRHADSALSGGKPQAVQKKVKFSDHAGYDLYVVRTFTNQVRELKLNANLTGRLHANFNSVTPYFECWTDETR
jgi:hypothetical protein